MLMLHNQISGIISGLNGLMLDRNDRRGKQRVCFLGFVIFVHICVLLASLHILAFAWVLFILTSWYKHWNWKFSFWDFFTELSFWSIMHLNWSKKSLIYNNTTYWRGQYSNMSAKYSNNNILSWQTWVATFSCNLMIPTFQEKIQAQF